MSKLAYRSHPFLNLFGRRYHIASSGKSDCTSRSMILSNHTGIQNLITSNVILYCIWSGLFNLPICSGWMLRHIRRQLPGMDHQHGGNNHMHFFTFSSSFFFLPAATEKFFFYIKPSWLLTLFVQSCFWRLAMRLGFAACRSTIPSVKMLTGRLLTGRQNH